MIDYSRVVRDKFLSAISNYDMLHSASSVVVAFSGGADSVCLLHLFKTLEDTLAIKVSAAHLNHGIRGDEAKRDEDFCRDFCENNGIPFYIKTIDCIGLAHENGDTVEERGRKERYSFFNTIASDNSYRIATAHNSNDNAETVIFNLCRGTALKGISGIPPVRDDIIRPLIYCSREEIEGYCAENSLSFMTDSTNLSDDYTRNNIRHNVLPVLREVNSSYLDKIGDFSSYAAEVSALLSEMAEKELSEALIEENVYDAQYLLELRDVLCRECIVLAFSRVSDASLTRQKVCDIFRLLSECGRLQIYGNLYCEVIKGRFRFFSYSDKYCDRVDIDLNNISDEYFFNGYRLMLSGYSDCSEKVNKKILDNLIDCDKIVGNIYISSRSSGDSFTFHGRKVTKSLKKLFNEINIPIEKRDIIPVLYDDEGVVWIYGVGTNSRCRVNNNATNIIFVTGEE